MDRPLRIFTAALVCLATFASSTLGFTNGMVLCTDSDGCVAREPAHEAHRGCHSDAGSEAGHEGEPAHLPHEQTVCRDVSLDALRPECVTAPIDPPRLCAANPAALPYAASACPPSLSITLRELASITIEAGVPRADRIGLRAIILLA